MDGHYCNISIINIYQYIWINVSSIYILLHLIKFYQVLASICMQEHYHKNEIVWPHGGGRPANPCPTSAQLMPKSKKHTME